MGKTNFSWETIKVWQLEILLKERESQELAEGWQKWSRSIGFRSDGSSYENENPGKYLLDSRPKAPAGFFLTIAAAICEYSHGNHKPTLEQLDGYLSGTFSDKFEGGKRVFDWQHGLERMLPKRSDQEKSSAPNRSPQEECLEHIQSRLETWAKQGIGLNTTLKDLLQAALEANRYFYSRNDNTELRPDENLISDASIQRLKEVMAETFPAMWMALPEGKKRPPVEAPQVKKPQTEEPAQPRRRPDGVAGEICKMIGYGVKQIILTGAPGTGKTFSAKAAASYLGSHLPCMKDGQDYRMVPFHPSYDYTDFVEGLRPIEIGGQSTFVRLDGHFKAFCRQVVEQGDQNRRYFFLIDEINRADLSKVFGELMVCLEPDKRGEKHAVLTQYQNLPTYDPKTKKPLKNDVFQDGFYVPENVYVIGTMNDIDRSVESMDFALHRRFVRFEVKVTQQSLTDAFTKGKFNPLLKEKAGDAAARVTALNGVITSKDGAGLGLNSQYSIAQGQFSGLAAFQTLDELLNFVWEFRLEPLLKEYVRGEKPELIKRFIAQCRDNFLDRSPKKEQNP